MNQNEPKDWEMSKEERKECKRINRLFDANHSKAKHRERVRRELESLKGDEADRMAEAFEAADSKAIQLHELLVRLVEMTNKPSKRHLRAKIISFNERMKEGCFDDLSFIQEAFLMGAEIGADGEIKKVLVDAKFQATPPHMLQWWQALLQSYSRQPHTKEGDKWLAVARMVVEGVDQQKKRPGTKSDYLTPRMGFNMMQELNIASKEEVARRWANKLRIYAKREKRKADGGKSP